MPYVGGVGEYRRICCEVAADGYRGFELGTAGTPGATGGDLVDALQP
jgi:cyclohexanone monooxygenase